MSEWKNYRNKERQDQLSEHEKRTALANAGAEALAEASSKAFARNAAAYSQMMEVESAASIARSKGLSTNGKIVGMASISPGSSSGWTVPDISVAENLEADENDPNLLAEVSSGGKGSRKDRLFAARRESHELGL